MRKPLIAGNWKMNLISSEGKELVQALVKAADGIDEIDIVVCPAFTMLASIGDSLQGSPIALGAQNMFWEEKGAFTGEVPPKMLKDVGCEYVIIGHSERRQYFGETDDSVNKKLIRALEYNLIPIICVGELLDEWEKGSTQQVVAYQVKEGLANLSIQEISQVVIAYEPVWAIGTGKTASKEDAQKVIGFIRKIIKNIYGSLAAEEVRILYGGSVNPGNIKELMEKPDIDGVLVGGASLTSDSMTAIIKYNG